MWCVERSRPPPGAPCSKGRGIWLRHDKLAGGFGRSPSAASFNVIVSPCKMVPPGGPERGAAYVELELVLRRQPDQQEHRDDRAAADGEHDPEHGSVPGHPQEQGR